MKIILVICFLVFGNLSYSQKIREKVNHKPDKTYYINAKAKYPLPNIKKVTEVDNRSFRKEFKGEKDIRLWVGGYSLLLHSVEIPEMVVRTDKGLVNHKTKLKLYEGIIEGDEGSIVSVLFKNNRPKGYISNKGQTLTINEIDSITLLYDESDFIEKPTFECEQKETRKNGGVQSFTGEVFNPNLIDPDVSGKCITNYWEVDYPIFVNKGSLEATIEFAQGNFLQVATLYKNVGINLTLIELKVWTVPSPYTGTTSGQRLTQFYTQLNGKSSGNLSHLLGYGGGGGVAYVNSFALCPYFGSINGVNSSTGYSGIGTLYYVVPAYSWNIGCITHEIGHNLGSNHSHDCVWNGNNTAIDGCGPQAGYTTTGCAKGPIPAKGVIMSYCHLISGVGISFAEDFTGDKGGFGKQGVSRMKQCIQVGINCTVSCTVTPPPPPTCTPITPMPTNVPCPSGTVGYKTYQVKSICINGVLTVQDTIWVDSCKTVVIVNDTTYKPISCFLTQYVNFMFLTRTGYTNYKYEWYKNGIKQSYTGIKFPITVMDKGKEIKCVVGSTNSRTKSNWWIPCETKLIVK